MKSSVLQRALPFVLTLVAGAALGGVSNLFSPAAPRQSSGVFRFEAGGGRRGCRHERRGMLLAAGVGRLTLIQRQTEDGTWVNTRPVGPEIYQETTRPAVIRSGPSASYTDEAREHNLSGLVTLEAVLSPDGRVTNIEPRWSLGDGLTVQATQAAQRLNFSPAIKDGVPVEQRVLLQYEFMP